MRKAAIGLAMVTLLLGSAVLAAGTPEQKCEAAKNQEAGKLAFCLQKAEKKLLLSGDPNKYNEVVAKCKTKFAEKWAKEEEKAADSGTACPTVGDRAALQTIITERAAEMQAALEDGLACPFKSSGCEADTVTRFVDNGDGTTTDLYTGLMWEVKDDLGGLHDKDNFYYWGASNPPNGTVFTEFLAQMNDTAGGGADCFAGYCDWRLPTIYEIAGFVRDPLSNLGSFCADPCVHSSLPGLPNIATTSSTTIVSNPSRVWVMFESTISAGSFGTQQKNGLGARLRAVRGGL